MFEGKEHPSVPDSFQGVRTYDEEYHFMIILAPIIGVIVVALIFAFTVVSLDNEAFFLQERHFYI